MCFHLIKIGLNPPREMLYENINSRVDLMIKNGLIDEALNLVDFRNLNSLQTVGYNELFDCFDNKYAFLNYNHCNSLHQVGCYSRSQL